MREILFRGKRKKTGEWVEGYLVMRDEPFLHDMVVPIGNSSQITYAVIRETVGQYTGLKDCNGKLIFEGDIVRIDGFIYHVEFRYSEWEFRILSKKVYCFPNFYSHADECEIIGNIHDNPELLEVQE